MIGSGVLGAPYYSMTHEGCTCFFTKNMSLALFLMFDGCPLMKRSGGSWDCIVCDLFILVVSILFLHG